MLPLQKKRQQKNSPQTNKIQKQTIFSVYRKKEQIMRVLRTSSYCYPEVVASSHLEKDRYEAFSKAGIELLVHAPTPTRGINEETYRKYKNIKYEELYDDKVKIHRFSMFREKKNPVLRAVRYVLVNVIQYGKCIKTNDVDVIYGGSTPPTQGVMCGMIKKKLSKKQKKKVSFVYNLQDIFPDSLVTTGLTKEGSLLFKIGRRMENYTYKNADKIIVISKSMKENILKKGVPEDKIVLIPNWIDTERVKPVPKEENRLYKEFPIDREKFTVLYAGNFGAAQGADVVLKAAELLKDRNDIRFVIFGGGSGFSAAKKLVEEKALSNVFIHPLLPQDRVSEVYSLGDIALVTCKKGVGNSGMPSKTWSIMATDTPIIASFDTTSELASIIEEANAGLCVPPEDEKALAKAIENQKDHPKSFCGARAYAIKNASKEVCVAKHAETILNSN